MRLLNYSRKLICWGKDRWWSEAQAYENVGVFGGTGSGKTSAEKTLIASMIDWGRGWGMLASCPKADSWKQLYKLAKSRWRGRKFIRFSEKEGTVFNPFTDIIKSAGDGAAQINAAVELLREVSEFNSRGRMANEGGENRFFTQSSGVMSGHAITLDLAANRSISTERVLSLLNSIPQSVEAAQNRDSDCRQICERALKNCSEAQLEDVRRAVNYFMTELPDLDPKTRSNIVISATTDWAAMRRPPLNRLYSGETNCDIPQLVNDGWIVAIDVPMSHESGQVAFTIPKLAVMRKLLSRIGKKWINPAVIYLQEGQCYASSADYRFVTMCRESKSCYFLSTQSISNLYSQIGNRDNVHALLACLNTRIYVASNCPETNEFASQDCFEVEDYEKSYSGKERDNEPWDFPWNRAEPNPTVSLALRRKRIMPPERFTKLKRGGWKNLYRVGAIVRTMGPEGVEIYDELLFDQKVGAWWRPAFLWGTVRVANSL
jgi:hypothetical protein